MPIMWCASYGFDERMDPNHVRVQQEVHCDDSASPKANPPLPCTN